MERTGRRLYPGEFGQTYMYVEKGGEKQGELRRKTHGIKAIKADAGPVYGLAGSFVYKRRNLHFDIPN